MKHLFKYKALFGFLISASFFTGCREDISLKVPEINTGEQETVTFRIPNNNSFYGSGTRADDDDPVDPYLTNGEGDLSNLYIIAVQTSYYQYDEDENGNVKDTYKEIFMTYSRVVVTPINVLYHDPTIDKYSYYNLNLYPGRYRFYVFANTDLYIDTSFYNSEGIFTEDDIQKVFLNYTYDVPLRKSHLPMFCGYDRIKYGSSETNQNSVEKNETKETTNSGFVNYYKNYTVEIKRNNKNIIFADMEFLCAKVRYTILFDATKTGISSGFGNQSIRFFADDAAENRPTVTNMRSSLFVDPSLVRNDDAYANDEANPFILASVTSSDGQSDEDVNDLKFTRDGETIEDGTPSPASMYLELNRYEWPDKKLGGANYPLKPNDELTLWDVNNGLDEWKGRKQRAWQGVVYLPENEAGFPAWYTGDKVKKTLMRFPYILDKYAEGSASGQYEDGNSETDSGYKELYLFGNGNDQYYEGSSYDQNYETSGKNYDTAPGLKRGYFYDVVALVENPDKWDLRIIVYGKVEPWHEIEQDIFDGSEPEENDSQNINGMVRSWEFEGYSSSW